MTEKEGVETLYRRVLGGILRKVRHSQAMSDTEIYPIGLELLGSKFIGVYARGEIDTNIRRPYGTCYILNTTARKSKGEHWLAIWHDSNNQPILFDSFARDRILPDFQGRKTDRDIDQEDWQNSCGQRCLAFLCVAAMKGESCLWI